MSVQTVNGTRRHGGSVASSGLRSGMASDAVQEGSNEELIS
jgi:hypothetical protein